MSSTNVVPVNQIIGPIDGSATNCNISWGGSPGGNSGTGFFCDAYGQIGVACNGVEIFRFTSSGGSEVGELFLADGTAAAPALAFKGTSANTGLYLAATDSMGFSANGTICGSYSSSGVWTFPNQTILSATSSQLVIKPGAFKFTITAATPAADRVLTIPDPLGSPSNFVLDIGDYSLQGIFTFQAAPILTAASNQLVIKPGANKFSITAASPAADRVVTLPDAGGAAEFVLNAGASSIAGVKTFSALPVFSVGIATTRVNVASTATIAALASTNSYVKLTGSTATDLQGIAAGVNGQRLVLTNLTGQNLTIRNQSASAASGNKITTMTGADVVTTGNGSAEFIYDTDASPAEWTCIWTNP